MERVFSLFPRLGQRRRQMAGSMSGGEQQMLAGRK
jgi:branched-chain amino acid transport system ATP-binding protein